MLFRMRRVIVEVCGINQSTLTMDMQTLATIFIIIHAIAGSVALLSGSIAIVARKGRPWHMRSGLFFYWGMIVTGITALIVTCLPGHESYFLFTIGVFSLYLAISGRESLRFKTLSDVSQLKKHKILSAVMVLFGVIMITMAVSKLLSGNQMGVVLGVFGLIGLFLAIQDFRSFRDLDKLRKNWLLGHIGKIVGAYIAAMTAFIVVNDVFPPLVNWLLPTVPGTIYSIYWSRKVSPKKKKSIPS